MLVCTFELGAAEHDTIEKNTERLKRNLSWA
jgi:hypothetical protein